MSLNDLVYLAKREKTSGIVPSSGLAVGACVTERGDSLMRLCMIGRVCNIIATAASFFGGDKGAVGVVVIDRL